MVLLSACSGGGGDSGSNVPIPRDQVIPEHVLISKQKISYPTPPIQYGAAVAWAQSVTLNAYQHGETAHIEIDYIRLIEQEQGAINSTLVIESAYDDDKPTLLCDQTGCEGALYERLCADNQYRPECWFRDDIHEPMYNSSIAAGTLRIDLSQTPNKVVHWWTPRSLAKQNARYSIESRFKITGKGAIQFGVDYWLNLTAAYNGYDSACQSSNNCEAWASNWYGDTNGQFVVKTVPLY